MAQGPKAADSRGYGYAELPYPENYISGGLPGTTGGLISFVTEYYPVSPGKDSVTITSTGSMPRAADDPALQAILDAVKRIDDKQDTHSETTTSEHQQMLMRIQQLSEENRYFRTELSTINTPRKLKKWSLILIFLAFISLTMSRLAHVDMLHPVVSYFMLGTAIPFLVMALLMEREDQRGSSYS